MLRSRVLIVAILTAVSTVGATHATARTVSFAGQTWTVKASTAKVGPGPNYFSDSSDNVWVDADGRLHLKITKRKGKWWTAEVIGTRGLGYGTYTWNLASRLDTIDPSAALGLFTWSNTAGFANREIDIEFSRWGTPLAAANAQYVVQPYDSPGHLRSFIQSAAPSSQHGFTWAPGSVAFTSSTGSVPAWTYAGADVPPAGDETPRMNLWPPGGRAPTDGRAVEIVIHDVTFTPLP